MENPTPLQCDMLILQLLDMTKCMVRVLFFSHHFLHLSSFPLYIMLDTSGTLNNYCLHYPNMEVHSVSHN